jgi:hypothetical protein
MGLLVRSFIDGVGQESGRGRRGGLVVFGIVFIGEGISVTGRVHTYMSAAFFWLEGGGGI